MLTFKQIGLVFVCDSVDFTLQLSRRSVLHVSMTELALLFWRAGAGFEELLRRDDYTVRTSNRKKILSNTNLVSKISRLPFVDTVFRNEKRPNGTRSARRRPVLWSKQNLTTLTTHFISAMYWFYIRAWELERQ